MIKAKFSDKYYAKVRRIKTLPKLIPDAVMGVYKKDAVGLVKEYKSGIRNRKFGLEALKKATIDRKKKKGYKKPSTPLYGAGLDEDNSLINCLRIRKLKNGWKVVPRKAKHHESKLTLEALFKIHEHGCTIGGETPVVIPPRPAFFKAYEKHMAKKAADKRETAKEVKAAIRQYVNDGKATTLRSMGRMADRWKEYERE